MQKKPHSDKLFHHMTIFNQSECSIPGIAMLIGNLGVISTQRVTKTIVNVRFRAHNG